MDHNFLNGEELQTLNLSGQGLKKLTRGHCTEDAHKVTSLSLDSNELQRLDNIDGFPNLMELSASHNQLLRMHSVNRLHHLVRLDLSHNNLLSIEGVKDLQYLKWLNLSGNNIKTIEHLHTNTNLEYLSLSENSISHISNLSHLIHLKQLFLHKNHIGGLHHCEVYLPPSLVTLTLAANNLTDLNHVSHLVRLVNLREFSISGNPCVSMTGSPVGFDYRPFLINWCMGLKVIDGYAVDDIESLKAEWLYSQGRGRQFRVGEQEALVQYLTETCPLTHHQLETEHERKLRLILSKAQHHQQQLRQEKPHHGKGGRGKALKASMSELMTRSLDPSLLDSCTTQTNSADHDALLSQSMHCPPSLPPSLPLPAPLPAASQLVPVPESLVSPSVATPPAPLGPKLQTIRSRAQEKRDKKVDHEMEKAAICIQKVWRGYHTRTSDRRVLNAYQQIQTLRTNQYIKKLSEDMQATREALDNEHKMQLLQMQAINALWKKVVSLQPRGAEGGDVRDLTETCSRLNAQVQQLQESMQEVLRCVSPSHPAVGSTTATQTDIVAVHTPQEPHPPRPSSLPLPPPPLTQYADCLVDGVIKTTVKEQEQPLEAESTHVS